MYLSRNSRLHSDKNVSSGGIKAQQMCWLAGWNFRVYARVCLVTTELSGLFVQRQRGGGILWVRGEHLSLCSQALLRPHGAPPMLPPKDRGGLECALQHRWGKCHRGTGPGSPSATHQRCTALQGTSPVKEKARVSWHRGRPWAGRLMEKTPNSIHHSANWVLMIPSNFGFRNQRKTNQTKKKHPK